MTPLIVAVVILGGVLVTYGVFLNVRPTRRIVAPIPVVTAGGDFVDFGEEIPTEAGWVDRHVAWWEESATGAGDSPATGRRLMLRTHAFAGMALVVTLIVVGLNFSGLVAGAFAGIAVEYLARKKLTNRVLERNVLINEELIEMLSELRMAERAGITLEQALMDASFSPNRPALSSEMEVYRLAAQLHTPKVALTRLSRHTNCQALKDACFNLSTAIDKGITELAPQYEALSAQATGQLTIAQEKAEKINSLVSAGNVMTGIVILALVLIYFFADNAWNSAFVAPPFAPPGWQSLVGGVLLAIPLGLVVWGRYGSSKRAESLGV